MGKKKDKAADKNKAAARVAGSVQGCHYTAHVDRVVELKWQGKHPEAIDLLLQLVDGTESEAKAAGGRWGVAPWYYECSLPSSIAKSGGLPRKSEFLNGMPANLKRPA